MNHPKPEEFVPYVYGESTGAVRRQLTDHLRNCPQCRQEIESWQRSLKGLDSWKLPRQSRKPSGLVLPVLRWTVAAALILFAGILVGRATAPKVDMEKLRAAVAPQIQKELSVQLAQLAREEATRAAALSLASGRSYTDQMAHELYVALKKDVDTVAFNTDAGLRNTAQQLVQLADYKEPQPLDTPNQ